MGLPLAPDPFPDRNCSSAPTNMPSSRRAFRRSRSSSASRAGTPEAEIERSWRATRYHSPEDDTVQTVFREDEIRLHDFIAALALRIANADARPRWNDDSFFRRFARD